MRVLVTGSGGFIGSHLVGALLRSGHDVLATDLGEDLPARLQTHHGSPGFSYRRGDVVSEDFFGEWQAEHLDRIFHLAAVVGVNRYSEDPVGTMEVSVLGTRNVIHIAAERGIRLLFTSTSEIYGKNPTVPWSENAERVLGPTWVDRWIYSSSKALCEQMLFAAARLHGFPVTIVRYFNVYGPHQTPDFVIPAMIQSVVQGRPPTIIGTGEETRCFTFVDDAIEGTLLAAESPEAVNEVFNIGNPRETRISELAETILRIAHREDLRPTFVTGEAVYGSYENVVRRVPDVRKARELLGWEASTSLEEGIETTLKVAVAHAGDGHG